jgi:ketosteroid isomerase-like protein
MSDRSEPAVRSDTRRPPELQDAQEIVADIERRWAITVRDDPAAISTTLYDSRAIFFGSKDEMFVGHREIARYFADIQPGFVTEATFSNRAVSRLSDDIIISGAYVTFRLSRPEGPVDVPFRITFTIVKTKDGWRISQHHASPRVHE